MEHIDALVTMHLPTITEEGNISDIFMYISTAAPFIRGTELRIIFVY